MKKKIATFMEDVRGFTGSAKLYELTPPLEGNKYVIVSATIALFSGHETLIFAADKNGAIKNWTDLPGSFRGGLDHEQALKNAGYKL